MIKKILMALSLAVGFSGVSKADLGIVSYPGQRYSRTGTPIGGTFMTVTDPPFNAKCDGVTHDDAAFALAIASASAQNGGTILVPMSSNPCILAGNPGINIQSNHVHIKGVGYGWSEIYTPSIKYIGTSTAVVIGGTGQVTDTQLEDLHIMGTSAATGSGIDFEGSPTGDLECIQCNLNRVSISGFVSTNTAGLFLNAGTLNTFSHVTSFANYYGVYISSLGNVTATHFDGISVRVNRSYGFYADQNTGFAVDGLSLFESNGDSGIAIKGAAGTATYSMFFHEIWMEANLTNYLLGTTTGAYQFQFLTNPLSPNQGLLRNVEIKNVVFGTQTGKGDIDVANADSVRIENIQSAASASSDSVKVELTATNVSLVNIYNANNGKIDSLSQATWNLSSGTVSMYGNLVSSGNITMGTTLKLSNNSVSNNILAQGTSGRLIIDGDGGGNGAEIQLNGSTQGASASKTFISGSTTTFTNVAGTTRLIIDGAPTTGGSLCLNSSKVLSKCTSLVDASGNCTCP